ncbi:MAG: L-lactate dehydrogenase [Clostridia bacterium]|nr:L-lactate dehydrogenase [Clostridiales bacterium]MBQ6715913.1 L-lactate dehydrogenase [Clostridia bacterium]
MGIKATIIGAGSVGSTIAFMMAVKDIASEVVLIDVNTKKAMGEALDIRQGTPLCAPITVYAGSYVDAADSDVVIITSGVARKAGQARLALAQTNTDIIKSIAPKITKYAPNAYYIIVSNPVDIMTYVFHKVTDIPKSHIIGTGTLLDTARLCSRLAEFLNVSQKNVHAYALGEHGDSMFVPWSLAQVCNTPLADYRKNLDFGIIELPELNYDEIEEYIRTSGGKIISRKGATYYAVSIAVCHIIECLFSSVNTVMAVSTMLEGEYGIDDVCLSIPTFVGHGGVKGRVLPDLTDEELERLHNSANVLKEVISGLEI